MPKQPGGISKSERVQAIIDLLNRAGLLDKQEINQRLASHFSVEIADLDRAVYRDLNELVDSGRISVCSKDSLGRIVNPELDDLKNFKNYWFTEKHSPNEVTGIGYLKENGFNLISHPSLQEYIKCIATSDLSKLNSVIILPTQKIYLGMLISDEIIPLQIFLSRIEALSDDFKEKFYKKNGKRSLILQIPNNLFSRFQGDIEKNISSLLIDTTSMINNPQNRTFKIKELAEENEIDLVNTKVATESLSGRIASESNFESTKDIQINLSKYKYCHIKLGDFEFVVKGNSK